MNGTRPGAPPAGPDRTVAVIDGGGANIASLLFALGRLGHEGRLTTDAGFIRDARRVILPGVGAARAAMERLREHRLDALVPTLTQPVLGICLGLQLLFDASEEDDCDCLGVIPGRARRFTPAPGRPVPHMGWNRVDAVVPGEPLLRGLPASGGWFYFVHSYAVPAGEAAVGTAHYGWDFTAVARRGNFQATQFHPERSGLAGATVLRNFLEADRG